MALSYVSAYLPSLEGKDSVLAAVDDADGGCPLFDQVLDSEQYTDLRSWLPAAGAPDSPQDNPGHAADPTPEQSA